MTNKRLRSAIIAYPRKRRERSAAARQLSYNVAAKPRYPKLLKEAHMLKRPSLVVVLLLALLTSGGLAVPAGATPISWPPGPIQSADRAPTRSITERWIVRLADPPVAQAPGISAGIAALG